MGRGVYRLWYITMYACLYTERTANAEYGPDKVAELNDRITELMEGTRARAHARTRRARASSQLGGRVCVCACLGECVSSRSEKKEKKSGGDLEPRDSKAPRDAMKIIILLGGQRWSGSTPSSASCRCLPQPF